jgi:hypothetical protein
MKFLAAIAMLSFALSLCGLREKITKSGDSNSNNSNSSGSNSNKSSSTSSSDAEKPEMTAAQKAALEGGQQATWTEQGLTWTVPAKWSKVSASENSFQWQSGGGGGAAFLIVAVSNLAADFPIDISTKAMYDQDATRKQAGEIIFYRYALLDGVKGVEDLEKEKSQKDDIRRLEWRGYRKRNGLVQLITIILSSQSQHFPTHDDALHAILYSTKIEKE